MDIGRRRAATPPWPGLLPVRAGLVIDFCTSPMRTGNSTYYYYRLHGSTKHRKGPQRTPETLQKDRKGPQRSSETPQRTPETSQKDRKGVPKHLKGPQRTAKELRNSAKDLLLHPVAVGTTVTRQYTGVYSRPASIRDPAFIGTRTLEPPAYLRASVSYRCSKV